MEYEIHTTPLTPDRVEDCIELTRTLDIARKKDAGADPLRQRFDIGLGLVVEIGDRELGPALWKCCAAAQARLCSLAMPTTRPFRPVRSRTSIMHSVVAR